MAAEEKIAKVLMHLAETQRCSECDTRLRWGDLECPHCGADLDDVLRQWATALVNELDQHNGV